MMKDPEWQDERRDSLIVDGFGDVLRVCATLRERRVSAGLSIPEVAALGCGDPVALAGVDDGDLGVPVEALVYYAAALGVDLRLTLGGP
jgi:hypothetical protein